MRRSGRIEDAVDDERQPAVRNGIRSYQSWNHIRHLQPANRRRTGWNILFNTQNSFNLVNQVPRYNQKMFQHKNWLFGLFLYNFHGAENGTSDPVTGLSVCDAFYLQVSL